MADLPVRNVSPLDLVYFDDTSKVSRARPEIPGQWPHTVLCAEGGGLVDMSASKVWRQLRANIRQHWTRLRDAQMPTPPRDGANVLLREAAGQGVLTRPGVVLSGGVQRGLITEVFTPTCRMQICLNM